MSKRMYWGSGRVPSIIKLGAIVLTMVGVMLSVQRKPENARHRIEEPGRPTRSVVRYPTAQAGQAPVLSAQSSNPYALLVKQIFPLPPAWDYMGTGSSELQPTYVASEIADFTGDGRNDVLTIAYEMPQPGLIRARVLPQMPGRTLGQYREFSFPDGWQTFGTPVGTEVADFNRDGVPDLVLTRDYSVNVMLSDSRGGWTGAQVTWPNEFTAEAPAVALDLNDDGRLDLVTHLSKAYGAKPQDPRSHFLALFGDGVGGFPQQSKLFTGMVSSSDLRKVKSLVGGDFNGDGRRDVAALLQEYDSVNSAAGSRHPIKVFTNEGSGGFAEPYVVTEDFTRKTLVAGDFNGDGATDLAAAHESVVLADATVNVYLQRDRKLQNSGIRHQTYFAPGSMDAADLDGDGKHDLVVTFDGQQRLYYYLQKNAALQAPIEVYLHHHPSARTSFSAQSVNDFNADRCPDVAIALTYGALWLLEGQNCQWFGPPKSTPLPALLVE